MPWWRSPGWWGLAALALPVWAGLAGWQPVTPAWPSLASLRVVVLFPVLEEIVFRAGLLAWLREQEWGRRSIGPLSMANILAAAVFAAMHLFRHDPLWAAAVFVPALLFGLAYERWGLVSAMALHVWYNAGFFTLYPPPA